MESPAGWRIAAPQGESKNLAGICAPHQIDLLQLRYAGARRAAIGGRELTGACVI
jgi:hypothetical protein